MDRFEVWQWETQGYLVVPGVMGAEWLAAANAAIDACRQDPAVARPIGASELWQEPDCSPSLLPTEADGDGGPRLEERMTGLEGLPPPHCEPFVGDRNGRRRLPHRSLAAPVRWACRLTVAAGPLRPLALVSLPPAAARRRGPRLHSEGRMRQARRPHM